MYIRWFDEIGGSQADLVGGKGSNLARLTQWGVPVPPGFCVDSMAYQHFIAGTEVARSLEAFLHKVVQTDLPTLTALASDLQAVFMAADIPPPLEQEIVAAYRRLRQTGAAPDLPLAVRSSATAEDLPGASFAGQHDSYLNIRGEDALLEHVKRCWASFWNPHAVHYRATKGFDHSRNYMAVVVQGMVPSTCAGVLFTANPVSGDRSEMVINSNWGLGESVVLGSVDPDTFVVDKESGTIKERNISSKESMVRPASGPGTTEASVPEESRELPSLSDAQVDELRRIALTIEGHYDAPVDIEWCFDGDSLYIVQARPITGLADG